MSDTPPEPRCMNLCCKSMIAFGESFEGDADYQAGMVDFWCIRTGKNLGPDGSVVSIGVCTKTRECFKEY